MFTADLPSASEMASQLRRLFRERDNVLLNAVADAVSKQIYTSERRAKALGITRTESGGWAMALDSRTAVLAPIAGSSSPTRIMEKSYA